MVLGIEPATLRSPGTYLNRTQPLAHLMHESDGELDQAWSSFSAFQLFSMRLIRDGIFVAAENLNPVVFEVQPSIDFFELVENMQFWRFVPWNKQ